MGGSEESIHDMDWVWMCVLRSGTLPRWCCSGGDAVLVLPRWPRVL